MKLWLHNLVGRLLVNRPVGRLVGLLTGDSIPFRGLRLDARQVDPWSKAALFFKMYESAECRFVERLPPLPVVELGAGVGAVTCLLARSLPKVVSVEANSALIPTIHRNLALNALDATVLEQGLGYEPLSFIASDQVTGGRLGPGDETIPTSTLSEVLEQTQITGPYSLVCDIEGGEYALLTNESLTSCKAVVMELHGPQQESAIEVLESKGFTLVDRHGPVILARRPD